jgi:hypothetical protein
MPQKKTDFKRLLSVMPALKEGALDKECSFYGGPAVGCSRKGLQRNSGAQADELERKARSAVLRRASCRNTADAP